MKCDATYCRWTEMDIYIWDIYHVHILVYQWYICTKYTGSRILHQLQLAQLSIYISKSHTYIDNKINSNYICSKLTLIASGKPLNCHLIHVCHSINYLMVTSFICAVAIGCLAPFVFWTQFIGGFTSRNDWQTSFDLPSRYAVPILCKHVAIFSRITVGAIFSRPFYKDPQLSFRPANSHR